jgi:hypothetical protein
MLTVVPLAVLALAGCGGANGSQSPGAATATTESAQGEGTIHVKLEEIGGVLIEGFKLDVLLEAPSGHPVVSSTWQQLVDEQHTTPDLDEYYDTVVTTTVPAGSFVLTTVMHPGMEPEQEPCVTSGQVGSGEAVTVTVKFSNQDGCSEVS